jgi:solute carrier family 12 (potassium/chloride transporters), member 9
MFVIQMGAAVYGIICFFVPHDYAGPSNIIGAANRADFPNHFVDNLMPKWTNGTKDEYGNSMSQSPCEGDCSYVIVFAVIFPMVTGIMEGANLSGDLKDPAKSLPAGTIWATVFAGLTYLLIILVQGAAFPRVLLVNDLNIYQNASYGSQYIIVIGILITSYSSGIGAMFGGCRILQAIARDDLFPFLKIFANGSKVGDEPREATVMTLFLSQAVIFMGSMDVIADIITAVFCLSYALINVTCFFLAVTGTTPWRLSWQFTMRRCPTF